VVENPNVNRGEEPRSFKAARDMGDQRIFYIKNLGIALLAR